MKNVLYLVHLVAVDVSDPALQRPHHHRSRARYPHRFEVPEEMCSTMQYVTIQYSAVQCVTRVHLIYICMSYVSYV
jgi:hypothetical protein